MKRITQEKLGRLLENKGVEVCFFDTVSSTNDKAKELFEGRPILVVAVEQTCGRGQKNRSFFSPRGGIYMSLAVKPKIAPEELSLITLLSGMAVGDSIKEVCKIDCTLKYVNDLLIKGKKLCGILTEASFEGGEMGPVVIGIGINVEKPICPNELVGVVTSLEENGARNVDGNVLAAKIVEEIINRLNNFSAENIKAEYSQRAVGIKP